MSALGSLVVKLALEYAEYTKGLEKSDQAALSFAQNAQRHFDTAASAGREFITSMARGAVAAVAAYATVNTVIEQVTRSIDSLAQLDDLTQKTGSTVQNLSRLQQVASAFGADMGNVDGALTKLAKGMSAVDEEGGKTHKALAALGLSAKDTNGKVRDTSEVFVDVAKRLQDYEDGASKAALVNDIFGKSGADLLPYLNDVAESVDKFTGVSAEAAAQAARYQDQLGLLRVKHEQMTVAIVSAALPAVNDLIGAFAETQKAESGLDQAGQWADDLAVGIARVVDVAKLLPGIFGAVTSSFKVVFADLALVTTAYDNLSPTGAAMKMARGENPLENLRKALAERNKVLDDANRRYDDLWNKPANLMEQSVLARIAARGNASSAGSQDAPEKKTLRYTTGTEKKGEKDDYEALNKALQEKLALSGRELELARPLTEAERQMATLLRGHAEGTVKLTDKEMELLQTGLMQLSLNQQLLLSRGEADRQRKEAMEANQKTIAAAFDAAAAVEAEIENYGLLPSQITRATVAKLEMKKASLEANEGNEQEIATTNALIIAHERRAAAQEKLASLSSGTDVAHATELLQVMEAVDDAAKRAAAGMEASFGRVGAAIGGLTTTLTGFGRTQAAIAAQLATATKSAGGDQTKIQKANAAAAFDSAQAQIKNYGDLSSVAKGFFKENTAGYRAMEGAEKAFRAFEMAMAVENMLTKSGMLTTFTALFTASKQAETAATVASVAPDVAASMAKGQAAAAAGVAGQAQGDPYSAWARMAAMAAVMAALGFAVSGGGGRGDTTAKDRQAAAGTGSILGDSSAKSDSIAKALELAAGNSSIELTHTAAMVASLRAIESSISGLGNLLVRESGLTGELAPGSKGAAYDLGSSKIVTGILGGVIGLALDKITGGFIGKITGAIAGAIFGGKVTTLDTGVTLGKSSLGSVMQNGVQASQYTDIKKDGGWFHSDKYETQLSSLGTAANDQFGKVIAGLADGVTEAGKLLGLGGAAFEAHLNSFVVDIGKVSLKGLTGEQIQKQLETVFAKVGDDLAKFGVGGLEQFQRVGEGYFETLARVATNYANLDSILAATGTTFGATGLQSIAARERLIELAGGISELASKSSSFAEHFLTDAERLAPVQKYVAEQLAAMGRAGIDTRDKFKAAVLGLAESGQLATEAGAKEYAALLALEDAFNKAYPATEKAASALELARSKRELEIQLMELQGDKVGALAAKRALELQEVDKTLQTLSATVTALQDLKDAQGAYDSALSAASSAIQTAAGQYQAFVTNVTTAQQKFADAQQAIRDAYAKAADADKAAAKAVQSEQDKITDGYIAASQKVAAAQQKVVDSFSKLGVSLTDFLSSLDTTDLAGASLEQRKAALEAQFAITAAQARAGDADAGAKLPEIAKNLISVGRDTAGSAVDFARIVANVRNTISSVQAAAASKVGNGEASNETSELDKALAEQKRWAEAVTQSGASMTKSADDLLKGYNAAVNAQQQSGAELRYWSQLAAATNVSLNNTSNAVANNGQALIKGLFDANAALAKAQIELTAANAIKGDLDLRQTTSLESFVASIKDVNTTAHGVMSAAAALFDAAGKQLVAGSTEAVKAQQTAKEAMVYWGDVVTKTAGSIAAAVKALADAAASADGHAANNGAAAGGAAGAVTDAANEMMVRGWYANNPQYGNGKVSDAEVKFWTEGLKHNTAANIKTDFAAAMARDHGFSTPLDISKFQGGGDHDGGIRLVGEGGPELEATGPSRIFNARQTQDILRGGMGSLALIAELQELRKEVVQMRAEQRVGAAAGVSATKDQTRLLRDVTENGTAFRMKEVVSG